MSDTASRSEIEDIMVKQAAESADYKAALLADPKGILEKQVGKLPEELSVSVVEEGPNQIVIRVPYSVSEGAELGDEDLEQVAGGKNISMDKVNCSGASPQKGGFASKNTISVG